MKSREALVGEVAITKYNVGGPEGSALIELALSRIKIRVLTEALKWIAKNPGAHTMNKTNVAIIALADLDVVK